MKSAPIALFVYNRPIHAKRVIEALQKNTMAGSSDLYVFSDGPKDDITVERMNQLNDVRKLIRKIQGFKSVTIFESSFNKGLSVSISEGINQVLDNHDRVIIFEDDILAHPLFLKFCNHALERYANNEQVQAISGFSFPIKGKIPPTYFIRFGATWGWACWRRSWKNFTMDSGKLIHEIESAKKVHEFDFNGNYHFFDMLKQHDQGKISSWDVCWYASIFISNGLSYYPAKTLTANIGMDGSGTHYTGSIESDRSNPEFSISEKECLEILNHHPPEIRMDPDAQRALTNYLLTYQKGGLINRLRHLVGKYVKQ